MSDIPPPLVPGSRPPGGGDTIYIPFLLADAPRLQLDYLSRHRSLPEAHRKAIKDWLHGYNTRLLKWIHDNYGPEAVRAADAMSKQAAQRINDNVAAAHEQYERELFAHLEQEMGEDGS